MDDLINYGGAFPSDSILGDTSAYIRPEDLNKPMAQPTNQEQPLLPKPTISQSMMKIGQALLVADQEGTGAAARFLQKENALQQRQAQIERAERRAARRERLDEYELLGRIRERQLAELQAGKKIERLDKLKESNPDLADLIDLNPSKAAEVLAERAKGEGSGPYEGTSIEAQDSNILLTGDPSSVKYKAAYNRQAQAKMIRGEDGQVYTIQPDMSAYNSPGQPRALTAPQTSTTPEQTLSQQPSNGIPASSVASNGGQPAQVSGAGDVPVRSTNIGGLTITEANLGGNKGVPDEVVQAEQMLFTLDKLIDEDGNLQKGVGEITGGPLGLMGRQSEIFPLTQNQREFQPVVNQIKGQAFLDAYERLKGGGVITEIEGKKATQALGRLEQYQSDADYAKSLKDLRDVVSAGLERARGGKKETLGMLDFPEDEQSYKTQYGELKQSEIESLAAETGKSVEAVKKELGIK